MDNITTIKDSRIKVKASEDFLKLLADYSRYLQDVPENIHKYLKTKSVELSSSVQTINDSKVIQPAHINMKLLKELLEAKVSAISPKDNVDKKPSNKSIDMLLYLNDLSWLSKFLAKLRKDHGVNIYLNELLENCQLVLPENEIIKRNPVLEARCQKLREEQQNLEYRKMTKNVDAVLKHYPEDTISYQIKAINSQVIAVLQFIFSVAAGFAFGFLGINLIIGNIEFGLRLLLGIMCALIIALAEIYFLAKKLNEYDNTVDTANKALRQTIPASKKCHAD